MCLQSELDISVPCATLEPCCKYIKNIQTWQLAPNAFRSYRTQQGLQLQINLTENGIKSLFFQAWVMATELLLSGWVWLLGLRSARPRLQPSPLLHGSWEHKITICLGRYAGFTAAGSSSGSWFTSSCTESVYSTNTATTNTKITLSCHPNSLLCLQVVSGLDFLDEVFPLSYMTSWHLQRGSWFGKLRIRGQVTRQAVCTWSIKAHYFNLW